ncbi:37288_t:CDS:2, partial [Gigaspora margarita]
FLKLLQSSYMPPHKDTLSGSVLNSEIVQIVVKMDAELQKTDNLTLSLDRWTSPRGDFVYNYFLTTPSHHEYLYSIADYLGDRIIQLAATFRKIPTSNNFYSLAIVTAFKKENFVICKLVVNYYKDLHHNEKEYYELWGVVENEHIHLQKLAKTMFAIVPSQANCEQNFFILKWFSERYRTKHGLNLFIYISNVKKKLNFCDDNSVKMELHNSVFNETIFAEINGPDLRNEEDNDEKIINSTENEITMAF